MSKPALILGAALLGGLALFTLLKDGVDAVPHATTDTMVSPPETDTPGITRHAFLDNLDLDADGGRYAVLLHPLATGGDVRAVTDVQAMRAAQGKAFYTDDPGEQLKITMLSILFLSPAGMPPDGRFATILRDKAVLETFTCYPAYCNGTYDTDSPHSRDLAGLLDASLPVEWITESYPHHDEARAAHWRALENPAVVQIEPPNLPAPNTIVFDRRLHLRLPAVLLEADDTGSTPLAPFDEDAYLARFTAAFTHAYPETEAYRLGALNISTLYPPPNGWIIVSDHLDGSLKTEDGAARGLTGIIVKEPSISINLTASMADRLTGPDPFSDMPEFMRPEPASVAERLDALAHEVLGQPCPGCFQIELPVATMDVIRVRNAKPPSYSLSYYRVVTP